MTPRQLAALGAVALLAVAGAAWLGIARMGGRHGGEPERVLPGLAGQMTALTAIRVITPGNTLAVTLQRGSGGWGVAERAGYPVDAVKLRRFAVDLIDLQVVDRKTSDPARYARLGVEDVALPTAQGVRVELDGLGRPLALIVGKDAGTRGTYVRREGEAQSLEASPSLVVDREARDWLDRRLLSLDGKRVRRIDVTPFQGTPYSAVKDSPGQPDFRLVGVPAGRKPYNASAANPQAQALGPLECDDVRKAADVDLAGATRGRVVYHTFDGLELTIDGFRAGGKSWLQVQAAANADAVRSEVEDLARRTQGWVYEVPSYRLDGLLRPVTDFLGP